MPVDGTDAHLEPVPASLLTADAVRRRFRSAPGWIAPVSGDGRLAVDRASASAAVLVPLVLRDDALRVLLTRRTEHLRAHAGQISFPGGRTEPGDSGPADTALREAGEEVGLPRDRVEVLGAMPTYTTVTGFVVTPVVALVHPPFALSIDPHEVAEAFEVPLAHLMTPANHQRHRLRFEGGDRRFLSVPWSAGGEGGDAAPGTAYFIWGATAAMLRNLYHFLVEA